MFPTWFLRSFARARGCGPIGLLVFFVFVIFEVCIIPDVSIQGSVADGAGIEDDVLGKRCDVGHTQVGAGGLQGIEQEAGGFVIDLAVDAVAGSWCVLE